MIARSSLIAALTLLPAVPALAQVVRPDSTPLAPIVITATRLPESMATLANSVTVLEGEQLRREGITTVADALRVVAGAAVVHQGSYGNVTSLFLRGGQSNYVRVLVDGVPINQPGGGLDLSQVTTAGVERIELVRGPASVVYGSDAVTGVLQIFTRQPAGHGSLVRAEGRAGTYGSKDVAAEAALAGAVAGLRVGVARSASDGIYPYNSGYRNTTLSAALRMTPDARTDLHLNARWNDDTFRYPTDGSGALADSNQFATGRATTVSLDAGRYLWSGLEVRALLGYREARDRSDDRPDNAADTLGLYQYLSRGVVDRRSADLRANLHLLSGTTVTLGGAVEEERERSSNAYESSFGPGSGSVNVRRTNRAFYTQAVGSIAQRVWIQAGARWEDNETFGAQQTWRLGGVWLVAPGLRLRANAGTAFKEPAFAENYSTGFSIGNPALKPEHASSWEAGLEQSLLGGRATVSASWFDQRFRDLIQYTFAPPAPTDPNYFNIAGASARGLELQAAVTPMAAFRLRAEFTLLTTAVRDSGFDGRQYAPGHRLIRRPTRSGALSADVTPAGRVSGGLRAVLIGSRDDLDFSQFPAARVRLPAYARFDLWAAITVLRRGKGGDLALTARLENAADASYQEVYGYRTPGRRLLLGARIDAGR